MLPSSPTHAHLCSSVTTLSLLVCTMCSSSGRCSWLTPPHPCSFSSRALRFYSIPCPVTLLPARDDFGFSLDTIHSSVLLFLHRAIFRQARNLVLTDFSEELHFPKTLWSGGSQAPAVFRSPKDNPFTMEPTRHMQPTAHGPHAPRIALNVALRHG